MINVEEKKRKIISFLKINGPALPVRIAKTINMDPIFASAILSELLSTKEIKMSHMKVGASPLYFIPGQEKQLENHIEHLKPIEKDTYLKLKEKGVLSDKDEEPAIRVALRSIKDFAIPYKENEKIMWKYAFEIKEQKKERIQKEEKNPEKIKNIEEENKGEIKTKEERKAKEEPKKEKPKSEKKEVKIESIFESEEEKPKFLNEVKEFLEKKEIDFIEEIQSEKKEIVAKVSIKSTLGKINFLMIAKNKKTISKEEINASLQRATYHRMPCLLIIKKEPSKTIQNIIDENHLIKLKIMP